MRLPSDLLRDSFALAVAREPRLVERFYESLFARAPELQPMFRRGRREQAEMVHSALAAVLDHLDDPPWLTATLGTLGARHASWGVTPPMYDAVGAALLDTLAVASPEWTADHERAWRDAYGAITTLMLAGVARAA